MNNARFWVLVNGDWVKLTLKDGEELSWYMRQQTEEGWSAEGYVWTYEEGTVTREYFSDGRDCDGRHSWSSNDFTLITDLKAEQAINPAFNQHGEYVHLPVPDEKGNPIYRPFWQQGRPSRQYDQFAEVAGY